MFNKKEKQYLIGHHKRAVCVRVHRTIITVSQTLFLMLNETTTMKSPYKYEAMK